MDIDSCQRQIVLFRERQLRCVVVCEVVRVCKGRQFEYFKGSLLRPFNWKGAQSRKEGVDLIESNSLAAIRHEKAVTHFIEPYRGNQSALF